MLAIVVLAVACGSALLLPTTAGQAQDAEAGMTRLPAPILQDQGNAAAPPGGETAMCSRGSRHTQDAGVELRQCDAPAFPDEPGGVCRDHRG